MPLSAMLIPAFNSAPLIGDAVGARIETMVVNNLTGGRAAVLGSLAARNARAWLMQVEAPGRLLHGAMMRSIRSIALALGWLRFAQRHIGRGGLRAVPRALIQGKRRKHA